MRLTLPFLCLALLLISKPVYSQHTNPDGCGTDGITPWFKWYVQHRDALLAERGGGDTTWLYVPTTVQITGTDQGKEYFNTELAINAMDNMNRQFRDARIRFYLQPGDPFRYLNNTYWHDHNWGGGADLIETNRLPDRLNAFVVKDPAGNCGYSWMDAIVLSKSCSGAYNSTWAHEAGHHLSLPHPFYGWEGESWNFSEPAPNFVGGNQVEKMDGSNCYNSGDFFCDTRPDYLSDRWNCNQNGESIVLQHDPNNVPFRSDATLLMGYSLDACASRFTPEQIQAMRLNLQTQHAEYLQLSDPLQEIAEDEPVELVSPIDTQFVQFDNATFTWNPVPNASLYTVEVGLFESILPKFVWQTVYNTTTLTVTNGLPNNKLLYWRVRPYSEWDLSKQLAPQQVGVFKTYNFAATNDLEKVVLASISPNPVSIGAPAMLQVTADDNMDAVVSVTDASGRRCYFENHLLHVGENLLEIPTLNLNAGIYFVTLQNELGTIIKRLAVTQ
ncbi:MAG: zinc-dependent metalloprotease [Saprospiraceae bacterium]|nr:zinc-dependent metalloprotease [Saprospiraceae bacterium]